MWTRVLCVCACVSALQWTPAVRTRSGLVRGLRGNIARYYGITYAVAERFQAPREPPRWEGVHYAVRRFGHCAQRVSALTLTDEQCLQLDVHAPATAARTPRPVLVFLHGGGYYYGTKAHYDPEMIVTKGVIVVVVNYRLGVFGFLCAAGVANLGLKDQVAALRWIRENIAAFGGDPDNVTLAGQSAGASAASMHLLSEASSGLFHKAILMSGTVLAPWAFNVEPLTPAFKDAAKLGLGPIATEDDILKAFTNSTADAVLRACADVSTNPRYFKYAPCIDSNHSEPFFRDTPYDAIVSGRFNRVPLLVGATNVEGMLFYGLNDDNSLKALDENFDEHLPCVFSWMPREEKRELGARIRRHYFGDSKIDRSATKPLVDYYSDWIAYSSLEAFTDLMVRHSDQPVYGYVFEYEGGRNFAKLLFGRRARMSGATHSDDIFYLFRPGGLSLPISHTDRHFIHLFTKAIVHFMKHGSPDSSGRWAALGAGEGWRRLWARRAGPLPSTLRGRTLRNETCAHALRGYHACARDETYAT